MAELDTATARRIHATADDMKHGDCHTARAVLTGMMPNILNEIDRLQAENQRLREEVATRILTAYLPHYMAMIKLEDAGLRPPAALYFDGIDLAADIIGVPADNTVETKACDIANATGEWPEGAYCRDWLLFMWCGVEDGEATIEQVVAAMVEAAVESTGGKGG